MRLPVSTFNAEKPEEGLGGGVFGGVVGLAVGPGAPEDARPGSGQDAVGVGVVAASRPGAPVDVGGPGALVAGVVGHAGERGAQALVAGPAPADGFGLAALVDKPMTFRPDKLRMALGRMDDGTMLRIGRALAVWIGIA